MNSYILGTVDCWTLRYSRHRIYIDPRILRSEDSSSFRFYDNTDFKILRLLTVFFVFFLQLIVNWNINTIFEKIIYIKYYLYSFTNQLFKLINTGSRGTLGNSRTPTWLFRDNDTTHYKVIMIINVNRLLYDHSHRERWWRWWSFCTGVHELSHFPQVF